MFERFTDRARRVVVLAQEEARLLDHNYIGTEHILLGLLHEGTGVAARALEVCDVSLDETRTRVLEVIGTGQTAPSGHIPFTPRAKKVLELSLREALQLGHNYIGTEHILLGLVREGEGVAAQVLVSMGLDLTQVRAVVVDLLEGNTPDAPPRMPGQARTEARGPAAPHLGDSWGGPRPVVCGFCGTPSAESGPMFTGVSGALICQRCARTIVTQGIPTRPFVAPGMGNTYLLSTNRPAPRAPAPSGSLGFEPPIDALAARYEQTGAPPDDEPAARAAVEAALLGINERAPDGRGLVNVEHGEDLAVIAALVEERIGVMADRSVQVVEHVKFLDATEAIAWLTTTTIQGQPIGPNHRRECRVLLVDGRWKVAYETVRELWALADVEIPPLGDAPPAA